MLLSAFHAKYFARQLSLRARITGVDGLAATLQDAAVDLLPHQIDAALFAFRNPLSSGVILGDEVGLGKTIEAALVIAQKWSEDARRILIVVPANLRRQWQLELEEKFFLPSVILDRRTCDAAIKVGENPFEKDAIVITSYQFAAGNQAYISAIPWDLAVLDEAHRLRNVFRDGNVIARALRDSLRGRFKLLLTATPLQNSLLELYGLVGFIDERTFGDVDSFKYQYLYDRREDAPYGDLSERLKTLCIRTLRSQVLEYIRYTNRIAITQEFTPSPEEQALYEKVSGYLQRNTYALPYGQRHLIGLMLWKLLASSTFAIAQTLGTLANRLEAVLSDHGRSLPAIEYDGALDEDDQLTQRRVSKLSAKDTEGIRLEIAELHGYAAMAASIERNAKGDALLVALETGFARLKTLQAPMKAVIFSESRRTQEFLFRLLEKRYSVIQYNGDTKDRQAVVEDFRGRAQILLATESAAEGLNLQFCSLVVNYDLPWNPQRIEQRIGRCHRYGQRHDVVVVNFLNKNNLADQRVFELLSEKFLLFEGVFGASDPVLGIVEGVDFERRIAQIYDTCRTSEEIEEGFAALRKELDEQIAARMKDTRQKLLENFDEDVTARLKVGEQEGRDSLSKVERMLWEVTRFALGRNADFDEENRRFTLKKNPYYDARHGYKRYCGEYIFSKSTPLSNRYRMKCSLAQTILYEQAYESLAHTGEVTFDLSGYPGRISALERLVGRSGTLGLYAMEIAYPDRRDNRLIFAGTDGEGNALTQKQMERMFDLAATGKESGGPMELPGDAAATLDALYEQERDDLLTRIGKENTAFFDEEAARLEAWARDVKIGMESALRELDKQIAAERQTGRKALKLADKLAAQERLKALEQRRNKLRMELYAQQDEIDAQRERLIEDTKARFQQSARHERVFMIRWRII